MASPVIQFKRGAFANLPGLQAGEPALTTDTFELYVGIDSTTNNNKFFGSHRYWTRESTSAGSAVNLVEGSSNGSNYISLKSPDSLAGITTYTFPATATDGYFLKTNSSGVLSWEEVVSTFDIAADSGSTDTVSTGATITFTGGTNVNTAVTDDTITINLDDSPSITNLNVSGITTLAGDVNLGDSGSDTITVAGIATFTTSNVYIDNQLYVGGIQVTGGASVVGEDITARHINLSGIATVTGQIDGNGGADIAGHTELDTVNVSSGSTFVGLINANDGLYINNSNIDIDINGMKLYENFSILRVDTVGGVRIRGGGTAATLAQFNYLGSVDLYHSNSKKFETTSSGINVTGHTETDTLNVSGISTFTGAIDANGGADISGHTELDTVNVGTALTSANLTLASGATITAILDEDNFSSDSATAVPTQQSTKAYVDTAIGNVDLTIDTAGDSGTGSVSTSQTLSIFGTANEIETVGAGQSITVGLPDAVTVTTALTTPTVKATNLQANDGTTAITVTNSTGAVATNSDLTVGGNLYVNGSTTQVNTTSLTVEDSLIEVGLVDGNAPGSDLNIDLGILFNYYTDSAKKSAVYWDDSASRIVIASEVSESSSVLTASAYAALEIGSLWVNDCAGQSQVINCSGSTRTLENITIDAGTF